jgi:hypothetical protein
LAAPLLLPAWPVVADSVRSLGLPASVVTLYSFPFSDWPQLVSPLLLKAGEFNPPILWWKTAYWGLVPLWAAGWGAWHLRRQKGLWIYASIVLLLCLGSGFAPSSWLWLHVPGLSLVRYPGNLLYLLLPVLAVWTAAGAREPIICALAAAELLVYGLSAQPTAARPFFSDKGPLVERLQAGLGGHRYLPSPKALEWHRGVGVTFESASRDLKKRLYGETNVPFRLESAGNFGEPLTPRGVYNWMDLMYRRAGPDELAPYSALADVKTLLLPEQKPASAWLYKERTLWEVYESLWAQRAAIYLDPFPEGAPDPDRPPQPVPLPVKTDKYAARFASDREDRWTVQGTGPGTLFVSEPSRLWRGWLNGRPAGLRPAYGTFTQLAVPEGAFTLTARFDRPLWIPGIAVFLLALTAAASPAKVLFRTK